VKKILLTGSMRSGTTFLANFVNTNDECILLRDALVSIFRLSPQLGINTFSKPLSSRVKNILLVNIKAEMSVLGFEKLHTICGEQFSTLGELFDLVLDNLSTPMTKIVGVKVTEAEDWLETIINDSNVLVIYLVRDLRDVLLSSNNRFPDYNRTTFAKKWQKGVSTAIQVKGPKLFFLKFEDLIQNPEKEVKKLSNFLEVSLDHKVKQLQDISNKSWIDNSSFHDLNETFDKKAIFRWKNNLDSKEVQYGSVVCRKLMKKLGYETNKISIIQMLKIKIAHSIPFPRKRQAFIKKLVRLSQKLPAALFKEKKLVEEKKENE